MKKAEFIKALVKGKQKETFGTNPLDPWSAKAGISETRMLDSYLLSRGIDPRFLSKDTKISHAKSSTFLKWKHDRELMGEGSVQDKLHARHQEIRKKSGLPHPDYYKELKSTFDLPDEERFKKAAELKKKYNVKEDTFQDTYAATQTVSDGANTPDDVTMKKRELTKSARMIKNIYKKKNMKEDIYDHEKDDKSTQVKGKQPKMVKVDKMANYGENKPDAHAILTGGKTMTGEPRDTIEIDPMIRTRPTTDPVETNKKK